MTRITKIAATFLMATTAVACSGEAAGTVEAPAEPVASVAAPDGGDWAEIVTKTDGGGYQMGNPDAAVKLIEYGSYTCPHCARFELEGSDKLVDEYVKTGRVSWEYRNMVRDPVDMTAALIARCGSESQFFPIQRALFQNQADWVNKGYAYLQQTPGIAQMSSAQLFATLADITGLKTLAVQRGLAPAKIDACLAEPGATDVLLSMNEVANSDFNATRTPTMIINGVTQADQASQWEGLSPLLATAVGE